MSVLAFDFGEKRIGVAVGDLEIGIAHPLETIVAEGNGARFDAIAQLIAEWKPTQLIVGLPSHMDGSEHELSRLSRRFARRLEGRFNLPAVLVDERLSSDEASLSLNEAGIRGKSQKVMIDQVAAQHILQSHFDSQQRDQRHVA
ncbi:MAG: Holliday junction resolvase RuvX [Methylophilales bacterium]|nr:Holliday junction resolvase RuvX [Methylophilales bacterium]